MRQALRNRHDPYLQFVALQLARNENKADEVAEKFDEGRRAFSGFLLPVYSGDPSRQDERQMPQLAGFFTGALAVHENLQLQTLRGAALPAEAPPDQVAVSTLAGVTAEAHPWEKLLAAQLAAGKTPQVSPLTLAVPADQYFVLFRSPGKLLELADVGDLWGQHLLQGLTAPATGQPMVERLTAQVVLPTDRAARPLYDAAVGEVALTGNDLYFREGTDVTFLFALKQPEAFRLFTDAALAAAVKARPDAVRETAAYQGVAYTHVATPDRAIHLFAADPRPGLHVRSNSLTGLRCVLDAIAGRTAGGQPGMRLGETTEFKYIRTLMVRQATNTRGRIHLSQRPVHPPPDRRPEREADRAAAAAVLQPPADDRPRGDALSHAVRPQGGIARGAGPARFRSGRVWRRRGLPHARVAASTGWRPAAPRGRVPTTAKRRFLRPVLRDSAGAGHRGRGESVSEVRRGLQQLLAGVL